MNTEICPICGIKKVDYQFYWGIERDKPASNDLVYSRACAIAKAKGRDISGCINPSDGYSEAKGWQELPQEIRSQING